MKMKAGNEGALSGDSGRERPNSFKDHMANKTDCIICKAQCKIKT